MNEKKVEVSGAFNTALGTESNEEVITAPSRTPFWNTLIVTNNDAIQCEVLLDADTIAEAVAHNKYFRLQAGGGTLIINKEDGLHFNTVVNRNLSTTTSQTVNTITFQASHVEEF